MIELDKFCRLCLTEGVVSQLFDESDESAILPLYMKVMRCTSVKIQQGDGLPTLLCLTCTDRVNSLWCFKKSTEYVDLSLRKLVNCHKSNAITDWEEKIKSIAEDAEYAAVSKEKKRKTNLHPSVSSSTGRMRLEERPSDIYTDDDPDRPETPLSPAASVQSPLFPSSPLSPNSKSVHDNHESTGSQKKKRGGRRTEYSCEYCGRKFPRSNHLAQHELTHVSEKPFQCSDCDKRFWYKQSLIAHIKQTHTGDVNYTCELCGKGFFKKTELTRHKPTHSNATPYKCPKCGLGFKIPKTLKRHIRNVHVAQRSHTCDTCGKSFTQLQTLKVHLLLHTGEKPHVCPYCGKGFAQSAPLKTHIRTHTGERPYTCHVCGDTFANRTSLSSHAHKHTDTLPYPCARCPVSFRLKKELVVHEQGHDDEERLLTKHPVADADANRLLNENQLHQEHQSQSLHKEIQFQSGNQPEIPPVLPAPEIPNQIITSNAAGHSTNHVQL